MSEDISDRLERIEKTLSQILEDLGYIKGRMQSESTIIKWVVFPLLVILAALIGLKLALPA